MGLFKRGYKEVEKEKERQEIEREKRKSNLWRMFLSKDGDEADIRFLTEDPVTFYEHMEKTFRNNKEVYNPHTCTGSNCSFCEEGDRPTFKGAYLVVDRREFSYKDSSGKEKKGKDQLRLLVQGTKVLSQLDRISEKYGITNRDITMVRLGSGTATNYTFERGDEQKLTSKEIENYLPEALRDKYDGTMESLYTIVENCLMPTEQPKRVEEYDDTDGRENIVSVEEEEEKPRKSKLRFGSKKPKENSVKSLFKKSR